MRNLYSVACNLYFGLVLISISRKAGVSLVPKKMDGTPIKSRAEALPERPQSGPYLLPPKGTIEEDQAVHGAGVNSSMDIKEWQARPTSRCTCLSWASSNFRNTGRTRVG